MATAAITRPQTPAGPRSLRAWWDRLRRSRTDARPAAAIRIAANALFLSDLVRIIPRHETLYFYEPSLQLLGLVIWALATFLEMIGLWTKRAAAVSFCCGLFFVVYNGANYHVDYYHQLTTFYLMFIESDRAWSIRSIRARLSGALPRRVWLLPIIAFQFHLATLYLDTGLSHVMANRSWREGYGVSQSLIHPQWSSEFGRILAAVPGFASIANWATVVFEVGFVFALLAYAADRRRTYIPTALALAAIGLHAGISMCYDIGLFGPQLVVLLPIFLPPSMCNRLGAVCKRLHPTPTVEHVVGRSSRLYRQVADRWAANARARPPLGRRKTEAAAHHNHVVMAILSVVLGLGFLIQQPVRAVIDKALVEQWVPNLTRPALAVYLVLASVLEVVGDARPHNVFSEYSQGASFSFEVIAHFGPGSSSSVELLFQPTGERIAVTRYMRNYMHWYVLGQRMAKQALGSGLEQYWWRGRFEQIILPIVTAHLRTGSLVGAGRIDIFFHAWEVPRRGEYGRKLKPTPRKRLATIDVKPSADGGKSLLEFAYF